MDDTANGQLRNMWVQKGPALNHDFVPSIRGIPLLESASTPSTHLQVALFQDGINKLLCFGPESQLCGRTSIARCGWCKSEASVASISEFRGPRDACEVCGSGSSPRHWQHHANANAPKGSVARRLMPPSTRGVVSAGVRAPLHSTAVLDWAYSVHCLTCDHLLLLASYSVSSTTFTVHYKR